MPISFPNFLAASLNKPDYSGIGDAVGNFYKGYDMPKDALIKEIQAKFAEPNAKEALQSSKLSNRKSQLSIDKIVSDMAQQKEFERQLQMALGGGKGNPSAMPSAAGLNGQGMPQDIPANVPQGGNGAPLNYTPIAQPSMQPSSDSGSPIPMGVAPDSPPAANQIAIPAPASSPEEIHEIIVSKGSPQLAGIDAMYDSNPLSRAFLEKKGFKKAQEIKFDNKTGRTSVITKWPSGKVTVQQAVGGGSASEDGAPLTSKMVSKHQNIISSVDVAAPVLKELAEMGSYPRQGIYRGGQYAEYEGLVSQAVDSVLGSFGLPMTNEGLKTIRDQIEIKTFETPSHYKKRINKLVEDLRSRQKYSAGEIKRTNKIQPISSSDSRSDEVESMSDAELRSIADG